MERCLRRISLFDSETGLEKALSHAEVDQFLHRLGLTRQNPDIAFLRRLIRAHYAQIPFQNLTMLVRPRRPPSWDEITEDMLSGLGGLCTTINPFFCALLHRLGFEPRLFSSGMAGVQDCHIALGVRFGGRQVWVDLANGFPYLEPLFIDCEKEQLFSSFHYRVERKGGLLNVWQDELGTSRTRLNQTITLKAVTYSQFETMRECHHTRPGFGPFLTGIRVNRWEFDRGFVLRDRLAGEFPVKWTRLSTDQIVAWLGDRFSDPRLPSLYLQALNHLSGAA